MPASSTVWKVNELLNIMNSQASNPLLTWAILFSSFKKTWIDPQKNKGFGVISLDTNSW